ncbi:hypothetical protein THII_1386 [Thioploca ingrica]|uniref:Uncharacterized protein n=1 Tax=Thioploca ingrica TaxID=40754 RepID=A0A090ACZ8_9GAMM|nr:hypothetical protein THII_1386 [Thioploca ingrica]
MHILRFDELLIKYMHDKGISVPELANAIPRIDRPTETLSRKAVYDWRKPPRPLGEGTLPSEREYVLRLSKILGLTPTQRNQFLEAVKRGYLEREQFVKAKKFEPESINDSAPCVVGVPVYNPKQFFGRTKELKMIFDLWTRFPLLHIALIGPKCSGKTSLLYYLQAINKAKPYELRTKQRCDWLTLLPQYRFAQINFANPLNHDQVFLFKNVLAQLDMPIPTPCDLVNFIETVTAHLNDIPTFILLDDIEVGLQSKTLDPAFWGGFRYLGFDASQGKLAFLLTAPEVPVSPLSEPSTFIGLFGRVLELSALHEAEADELLDNNAETIRHILNVPEPFTAEDKVWMLKQSQGWPALLQILCNSRFEAWQADQGNDDWKMKAQEALITSRCWHHLGFNNPK